MVAENCSGGGGEAAGDSEEMNEEEDGEKKTGGGGHSNPSLGWGSCGIPSWLLLSPHPNGQNRPIPWYPTISVRCSSEEGHAIRGSWQSP